MENANGFLVGKIPGESSDDDNEDDSTGVISGTEEGRKMGNALSWKRPPQGDLPDKTKEVDENKVRSL